MFERFLKFIEKIVAFHMPPELVKTQEIKMARREPELVRVKVLRCFQNHEEGSVVDISKGLYANLSYRKMVELYAAPKAVEVAPVEAKEPEANRSVGLAKSSKKVSKRTR